MMQFAMSRAAALVAGVIAASLGTALLATLFAVLFDSAAVGSHWIVFFIAATVVSLAHTVVLGLPTVVALVRSGHFRLFPMLLVGFLVGSLPATTILAVQVATSGRGVAQAWGLGMLVVVTGALGCVGAMSFFAVSARSLRKPG